MPAAGLDLDDTIARNRGVVRFLRRQHQRGARIAGILGVNEKRPDVIRFKKAFYQIFHVTAHGPLEDFLLGSATNRASDFRQRGRLGKEVAM